MSALVMSTLDLELFVVQCEALEAEEQLLGSDPQRVADLTVEIAELLSSHLKKSEYETGCLSNANGDQQVIEYVRRSIEFRRQLCEEESENSEDIVMTRRELAKALRLLSFHLMSQAVGTSGGQLAKEGTLLEARKSIQECTGQLTIILLVQVVSVLILLVWS